MKEEEEEEDAVDTDAVDTKFLMIVVDIAPLE